MQSQVTRLWQIDACEWEIFHQLFRMSHTVQELACAPCLLCGPCLFDLSNLIYHFGFEGIENSIKMFRFYHFILKLLFSPPLIMSSGENKKPLIMSEREFKVILLYQIRSSFCYIFKKLIFKLFYSC